MPRPPQKMSAGSSPFATEWNNLVDYLRAVQAIPGPGTTFSQTSFGTSRNAANVTMSVQRTIYIKVCRADGTEEYMPVMVAGPAVAFEDIPTNSEIYDPPA